MKKKLYITRAIKITALLLIVVLFSLVLQSYVLVHYDGNRMRLDGYYLEEKNSLDVVFIGASDIYASFAPGLAYEKFGFTSYSYATASSTAGATKTMLKEVLRTQNPQKIVIEVNAFLYGFDNDSKISSVRNYIDNVPLNENKIEYLQSGAIPEGEEEIEYYLPLIKYHSTWNDYPEPSGKYLSQIITQHMDGSTKLKATVRKLHFVRLRRVIPALTILSQGTIKPCRCFPNMRQSSAICSNTARSRSLTFCLSAHRIWLTSLPTDVSSARTPSER